MPQQTVFLTKYPVHEALFLEHPTKPKNGWNLNSPVFRHRAVMALFPEIEANNPRSEAKVLFRLDTVAGQAPYFLIQSTLAPRENLSLETKEIELLAPPAGSHISFRLSVNAVKRKHRDTKGVTPIPFDGDLDAPQQLPRMTEWLAQKLSPALDEVTIMNHQRQALGADRQGKSKDSPFVVQVDLIDGFAQVKDPEHLEHLLLNGVGRAKSYGCGLLSIRRLSE